jgi:hypothetical protein
MSDFTFADLEERIPTREEEAANRPPPAVAPQMIENGRVLTLTSPQRLAVRTWTLIGSAPWTNRFGREVAS